MCCEKLRSELGGEQNHYDSRLSAHENRRKFVIQLPKNSSETFCRVKIDGGLIPAESNQERCDFMFLRCAKAEVFFVEMKGKAIKKAFSQIVETIEFARPKMKFEQNQVSGFIIASRVPSGVEAQKLKKDFVEKKYGQTLAVHSREWTHKI
jgi:hypothetical protein